MGFLDKVFKKSVVNTFEGALDTTWGKEWFQVGKVAGSMSSTNPDVAAAVSLYKRALMAMPVKHIVRNKDGAGITVDKGSPLSQVITRPNQYMSWAELIGVIVDGLLQRGEFACYVEESNGKHSVHPLPHFQMIAADNGDIFYSVSLSEATNHLRELMITQDDKLYIPQRSIVHGRFEVDPRNPLRALSPLAAYSTSIGLGDALRTGQLAFHVNKSQPSGVITTEASLTTEQAIKLRDRWEQMSQGMKQGKTPILSNGLKFQAITANANEAQVIQLLGFTTKDVAKAFGIPPVLLGESSGVTYNNLEQLLYGWRTTGLLSVCIVIEQAFEYAFDLPDNEELVLDLTELARAESLSQADTLTKLVQNGILKPNEARAKLDMAPVQGVADELVAQQQIQPIQQTANIAARNADREDEKLKKDHEVKLEAAKNPPKPAEEPEKPVSAKSYEAQVALDVAAKAEEKFDLHTFQMMVKGVLS